MIDINRASELLKQAVETQGEDFRYAKPGMTCYYEKVTEGHPDFGKMEPDDNRLKTGCIVGVALDLAGETFHHGKESDISYLAMHNLDKITIEAGDYLSYAQAVQDNGATWGDAYKVAEAYRRQNEQKRTQRFL